MSYVKGQITNNSVECAYESPKCKQIKWKRATCGAFGTYTDNRKECPRNADNSLSKKSARGSIRWIRDGPLVFVKWMDTQEVSVCSTIHSAYTGETMQRRVKTLHIWKTKAFPCPAPVIAYYQHMGDLTCLISCCSTTLHSTKQWSGRRRFFFTSWALLPPRLTLCYKELYGNWSHKDFMEQIITELCGVSQKVVLQRTSSNQLAGPELCSVKVASVGRKTCVHCKAVHGKTV